MMISCRCKSPTGVYMTADELRKKNRTDMAKPNTRPVKVGRYNMTSHAQNRMIKYDFTADCVIHNLCRKPKVKTPVKYDTNGPSYLRINEEITTAINPNNKNVTTLYRTNKPVGKRYGFKVKDHLERESERIVRLAKESASKKSPSKRKPAIRPTPRVAPKRKPSLARTAKKR